MKNFLEPVVTLGPLRFSGLAALIISFGVIFLIDSKWSQRAAVLDAESQLKQPDSENPK